MWRDPVKFKSLPGEQQKFSICSESECPTADSVRGSVWVRVWEQSLVKQEKTKQLNQASALELCCSSQSEAEQHTHHPSEDRSRRVRQLITTKDGGGRVGPLRSLWVCQHYLYLLLCTTVHMKRLRLSKWRGWMEVCLVMVGVFVLGRQTVKWRPLVLWRRRRGGCVSTAEQARCRAGWCCPGGGQEVGEPLCWKPSSPMASGHRWRITSTDTWGRGGGMGGGSWQRQIRVEEELEWVRKVRKKKEMTESNQTANTEYRKIFFQ